MHLASRTALALGEGATMWGEEPQCEVREAKCEVREPQCEVGEAQCEMREPQCVVRGHIVR